MNRDEVRVWAAHNAVRADHLGPCNNCPEVVRAGTECSTCLEDLGVVRHLRCCAGECFQ